MTMKEITFKADRIIDNECIAFTKGNVSENSVTVLCSETPYCDIYGRKIYMDQLGNHFIFDLQERDDPLSFISNPKKVTYGKIRIVYPFFVYK